MTTRPPAPETVVAGGGVPAPGPDEQADALHFPAPYEDRGELGRGGMGAVHGAYDRDLERTVAIKALLPGLDGDDAVVRTFVDEARITALIEHPNVAPVHRLERREDGSLLLVMKMIEGRTLRQHLDELSDPPWTPETLDGVLSAFVKVCDAVAFAHSRGVIHLDLKATNVMLGPYGQVYVLDWGVARYKPPDGAGPTLVVPPEQRVSAGTPAYMSPEQAMYSDDAISERTDVYLLGAMLYEILTGVPPHGGRTMAEILGSAIRGVVVPPAERAPARQPPAALAEIAMRALDSDPARRYPGVLELEADVKAFRRGEERAPHRTFPAGTVVFREGEPGEEAYVIVRGRCVVTASSHGTPTVLRDLGPGDLFGEMAVISDVPRSATVEAVEDVVVRVVTRSMLTESLGLDTWAGAFVRTLAARFAELDRRVRDA